MKAYVTPDAKCDNCHDSLFTFPTFYDSRIRGMSSWGWLCRPCWRKIGVGVGVGVGQEYDSTTKEKVRG